MAAFSFSSPLATNGRSDGHQSNRNREELEAWAPIVGGSALFLYGLSRRSLGGLALASVGGALFYRGIVPRPQTMRTGAAITISKSPEELYRFWRNFENLPRIMQNLVSVDIVSGARSHWTAKTIGGVTVEWDAAIIEEEPDRRIAWRSEEDAEIATNGVIEFEKAPGDRGTEVHLNLEYTLPVSMLGAAAAAIAGEEPSQQARIDLRRFKQFMETGEIATTEGQPHGKRGRAPDPETSAGFLNNLLEGASIIRTGGRTTRSRAGTRV